MGVSERDEYLSEGFTGRKNWHLLRDGQPLLSETGEIIRELLDQRGLQNDSEIESFLNPRLRELQDPFRLPDMEAAVRCLEQALKRDQRILIFSDYDVDGMSSGALMYRFLVALGAEVEVFIPERQSEGYGLSVEALENSFASGKPDLVLALDCGTNSTDEVNWMKSRGVGVVIIDHHELGEELPPADAVVNPQRGESDHYLATVGLVFKTCHAFLKSQGNSELFDLRSHLDYVALGTVADMVPLIEDNRILVHHGLKQMASTIHVGLQELMRVARVRRAPDPSTIGFILGPRLNASGRLAAASTGWELLATRDPGQARKLARTLDQLNRDRQRIEQEAYELARQDVERMMSDETWHCLVVAGQGWHPGVVGIVASRLQRDHFLPAIVITTDETGMGKGSARSIPGLSVMDGLRACQDELVTFGGHAMAAGLEIEEGKIDAFREKLNRWFAAHASEDQYQERLVADMKLPPAALTADLAKKLNQMEPFGQGNPAPIFVVEGVRMKSKPRVFSERHLKFLARIDEVQFDVVAFSQALGPRPGDEFSMAGHWEMDSYTGSPVFRMLDWNW